MEKIIEPFEFKQCVTVPKSTGKSAKNLRELRQLLRRTSDESIIHHTCQYFLHGHVFEHTNGFAQWAAESLGEKALGGHGQRAPESLDSNGTKVSVSLDPYGLVLYYTVGT